MEEFKGTRGPWEAKTINGDLKVIQKGSYEKLGPGMVSYCCVTELENKHDAKLIAAAPELLEALRKLRDYAEGVCGICPDECHEEHPMMLASSVIAKALGK